MSDDEIEKSIEKFYGKPLDQRTKTRTAPFSDEEKRVISLIVSSLRRQLPGIAKIDLFGSRARNDFQEESDYDVIASDPTATKTIEDIPVAIPGVSVQAFVARPGELDDWLDGAPTIEIWNSGQ